METSRRTTAVDTVRNIGADASALHWPTGGFRRFVQGVLPALAAALSDDERLTAYYNRRGAEPLFDRRVRERYVRLPTRTLWNQVRLPLSLRRDHCDVYLGTGIATPWASSVPCVPVIYDCLAFRDPAAKPGSDGRYWRRWTRAAVRRAPRIVTISRFVAGDIHTILGADESVIRVVYCGVDDRFSPVDEAGLQRIRARLAPAGVPKRFVLHVGSYERHKGAGAAAGAVEILRARGQDVTLVRCGPPGPITARDPRAVTLGLVDDTTLVDLYRAAEAVSVTSSHEGFGLPVLEAMACGTPVVATRAGALPEAGGDVAEYADGLEPAAVAEALLRIMHESPEARAARRTEALRRAATFTWDRTARGILDALREAAAPMTPPTDRPRSVP